MIRTQVDTNNRLFNYRDVTSNGIFTFTDGKKHKITYRVKDVYGNSSALHFKLQSGSVKEVKTTIISLGASGTFFNFRKQNEFSSANISLSFPVNAFYRSFYFQFDTAEMIDEAYSPLYKIHNRFTPIQKSYTLKIKPTAFPQKIKSKLYIAIINNNGAWYIGGDWEGDQLVTGTRLFGNYTIMADTIAPEIIPGNIYDEKRIIVQKNIRVEVKDQETGIGSFRGTLNDEWILMEYDSKKATLTYDIDEHLKAGENKFRLVVKDELENETIYDATLYR